MPRVLNTHRLPGPHPSTICAESAVVLRFGFPDDDQALAQLALLDSSRTLAHPVLIAQVGEEVHAALSLADGAVVADPFHPTTSLIALLRARAEQLHAVPRGTRPHRLRLAALRRLMSPQGANG